MRINFEPWWNNLMEWEGFRSHDPDDPGGRTVYGISEKYFPWMYPVTPEHPQGREPSIEDAKAFYLSEFWVKCGCDELPAPMDFCHADSSVNPGPGAARGFLTATGEHTDPWKRLIEYQVLRLRYYLGAIRKRPTSLKYLSGWADRCLDMIERTSLTKWSLDTLEDQGAG